MLCFFNNLKELNFGALMELYREGNRENAESQYPGDDLNIGILKSEQDFYQYLQEVFFTTEGATYAVWEEHGCYMSALRLEPYRDGLLLEALETHPNYRRMGYAKALISAVLEVLKESGIPAIYAHVHKRNDASLRTHASCGFRRVAEQAVYIDGSVNRHSCTLQYFF